MSDISPRLDLPLLLPAQAQKHVTHNEALDRLDILVQMVVERFGAETPPDTPAEGQVWALGSAPTGVWAGHGLALASWRNGAWVFATPAAGWRVWGRDEDSFRLFSGPDWISIPRPADLQNLDRIGINATADSTNRLTVSANSILLSHDGADHRVKINKAAATDTASLLFQSDWSGRAELGLTGSDAFSIKVSGDGSGFITALTTTSDGAVTLPGGVLLADGSAAAPGLGFAADSDTGIARPATDQLALVTGGVQRALLSPGGLQLSVPLNAPAVQGSAVQAAALDATSGRLITTGGFGLGAGSGVAAPSDDADLCTLAGLAYRFTSAGTNTPGTPYGGSLIVSTGSGGDIQQIFLNRAGTALWLRGYSTATSGWSAWQRVIGNDLILGTVSQSGGVPTGAVIERGVNANGSWTRFADGTQICTHSGLTVSNASTADGALYRSADASWSFPQAFADPPVVSGGAGDTDCWISPGTPTTSACTLRVKSSVSKASTLTLRIVAQGSWF